MQIVAFEGSATFRSFVLLCGLALVAACGNKAEEEVIDLVPNCEEVCTEQSLGTDCDAPAIEAVCFNFCPVIVNTYAGCEAELEVMYDCQREQAWTCDGSLMVNDIDMAVPVDPSICADFEGDLGVCLGEQT